MAIKSVLVLAITLAVICLAFSHSIPEDSGAATSGNRNQEVFRIKRQWDDGPANNNNGNVGQNSPTPQPDPALNIPIIGDPLDDYTLNGY